MMPFPVPAILTEYRPRTSDMNFARGDGARFGLHGVEEPIYGHQESIFNVTPYDYVLKSEYAKPSLGLVTLPV